MIVLVVGMHRSGTSTVAGLLHQNGVTMGEDEVLLPRPSPENPRGFFENHRFRALNDRIVERSGYRITSWRPEIPPCRPGALARWRMRRLLRDYEARHPLWGFKDPRTCLTLDAWLRAAQELRGSEPPRVVFAVRDPDPVARSLATRNGLDRATALRLWKSYNERALAALDAWRPPTWVVRYEDLCAQPAEVAVALCRFAGAPRREVISTGIVSPALDRSSRGREGRDDRSELGAAVAELRERILRRAREGRRQLEAAPAAASGRSQ